MFPTSQNPGSGRGSVTFVGAGPGDPGLMTWRGLERLRQAEVVLYDYLVNPDILEQAPATAEKICVGRHNRHSGPHDPQPGKLLGVPEIVELMIDAARAGRRVVRLKGGDPAIFARLTEEVPPLRAAGIAYELIPGVTAAGAATCFAGIPLTAREHSSAVAFVTGQEDVDKSESSLDYAALAGFPGTLVFYMGATTAGVWSRALLDAGKPAETPVAILRRCSWPDQLVKRCRLDEVSAVLDQRRPDRLRPPVLAIVGPCAADDRLGSWFTDRPLFGQRILVTRAAEQAGALRDPLRELGAEVLSQPALEIGPPTDPRPLDEALAQLERFDWLVFSSANGVNFFLARLFEQGHDLRRLGRAKLAAIGPGTADALRRWHLRADLVPAEFRAESLAAALASQAKGQAFLLLRASRGREVLAAELQAAGGSVTQVVVYASVDIAQPFPEIQAALAAGRIDWVTVTSSAIARSLVTLFGEDLRRAQLVSISPITSDTLRGLGFAPAAEARVYTLPGVIDALLSAKIEKPKSSSRA